MYLKVQHKPNPKLLPKGVEFEHNQRVYHINRREVTYAELFDMVYKDVIGDENTEKKRSNFRLRMY